MQQHNTGAKNILLASKILPSPASERELVIEPRKGWIAIDWAEIWDQRELLFFLVQRDVKVRYKQTVLGVAWAALQPLLSMVIFTVIFGRFAKVPSDGVPYALFVFCGLLPWTFFSNSVSTASQSLIQQQALLTKVYLPRVFIPVAPIGTAIVDLVVSLVILACLMYFYGAVPPLAVVFVPVIVLITAAAAAGLGLALAALTVSYRDFRFVIPFFIQAGMYISPVIYPVSLVPPEWQWVLALNPMTGMIDAFRSAILGVPFRWTTFMTSSASACVLLVYGLFYFRKMERRFADVA